MMEKEKDFADIKIQENQSDKRKIKKERGRKGESKGKTEREESKNSTPFCL